MDLSPYQDPPQEINYRLKKEWIINDVLDRYNLNRRQLNGHARDKLLVDARFELAWRLRRLRLSTPHIGRIIGGRDHTTIIHYLQNYEKRLQKQNAEDAPSQIDEDAGM